MARRSKAELEQQINTAIVQNDTGAITADVLRGIMQDILDSSPAGVGSDVLNEISWTSAGWTPVSSNATQYLIATSKVDFDTLQRSLIQALTAGGSEVDLPNIPAFVSTRLNSYLSLGGTATGGNDALLDDLWPLGTNPPLIWLVTPTRFEWLDRSRVNVSTRRNNFNLDPQLESLASFGRLPYTITINGIPYDVGRYRTSLARPVEDPANLGQAALRFQYRYSAPPPGAHIVNQVP